MQLRILFFPFLAGAVLLTACKHPGGSGQLGESMDSLVSGQYDKWNDRDSSETKADPIKSGIIYMVSTQPIHGSDVERTIYFDDYGHKRYTETVTSIKVGEQRVTTTQITLDVDGMSYKYDPEKKTGFQSKSSTGFNPTQIDFTRLDKMTMEDFGIKTEGKETVAGKECVIYSINYPAMNFTGRYAVWNNLPLHEEFKTADFGYEYIATKLVENANIEPSRFLVPSDITFAESGSRIESTSTGSIDSVLNQAPKQ